MQIIHVPNRMGAAELRIRRLVGTLIRTGWEVRRA
jgi:hypothetical protein